MTRSDLKLAATALAMVLGLGVTAAQARDHGGHGVHDFETLDIDDSGEITESDLEQLRANRFAEIDTDGDGNVTEAEFTAHAARHAQERAAEMFARLDADGDGILSRDALETGRGRMSMRFLTRADTDGSGGISLEEFEAMQDRFAERRMGGGKHGFGRP